VITVVAIAAGLAAWTWLGYPLVIYVCSHLRRPRALPTLATVEYPSVTAVLATRDSDMLVAERVRDFLAADYPPDRLTVVVGVDQADADRLQAIRHVCGNDVRITVVSADAGGGKVAGLNAAIRAATGDVLVFSDAQQRFASNTIARLTSWLTYSDIGVAGGALQLPGDRAGAARSPVEWYWWFERHLRAWEARLHSSIGISGSIYAMRRADWQPLPVGLILDDVWVPMQQVLAGKRVMYDLQAHAWDARSTTATQEKTRKVRTLTGNFQLAAWMPTLLMPWRNPAWVQFVSHKLFRLLTPWLVLITFGGAALVLWGLLPPSSRRGVCSGVVALVLAAFVVPPSRRLAFKGISWGWSLQTATIEATMNGLRGRWDVWR
jgi:cellulose synthase/poly-beta-1,6-N-acetylglucosamine synthase-like glycosyltransferase